MRNQFINILTVYAPWILTFAKNSLVLKGHVTKVPRAESIPRDADAAIRSCRKCSVSMTLREGDYGHDHLNTMNWNENEIHSVLSHDSALQGCTGPETTWVNEMNMKMICMNRGPSAGSIVRFRPRWFCIEKLYWAGLMSWIWNWDACRRPCDANISECPMFYITSYIMKWLITSVQFMKFKGVKDTSAVSPDYIVLVLCGLHFFWRYGSAKRHGQFTVNHT